MATKSSLKKGKGKIPKSQTIIMSPKEIEKGIQSTSTVKWDPFTVFPAEIYLQIFNHLDNSTDQENFMNSHVKFYNLFKSSRVHFLFGKVFNDLLCEWGMRPVSSYLNRDHFLFHLRLVCHKWDVAIQNYYQLHPSFFLFDNCEEKREGERYGGKPSTMFCWNNKNPDDILKDWKKIQASHPPERNPFLTRSVVIAEMVKEGVQIHFLDKGKPKVRTWWTQIEGFLKVYGHHVWHLKLAIYWRDTPDILSRVVNILKWLPKLRTLRISSLCYEHEPTRKDLKPENVQMPEMKELKYLQIKHFPKVIYSKILEGMKGLEKLQVIIINKCRKQFLADYPLPATLKEACLTVKGVRDFKYLKSLKPFPLLRKLIIQPVYNNEEEDNETLYKIWPEWEMIWVVIEEKFPGLEDLNLYLPAIGEKSKHKTDKIKALKQSLSFRLSLKRLKRLTIDLPNMCSLDFLQEMKELEEIDVFVSDLVDENGGFMRLKYLHLLKGECIKFNRNLSTMQKSNIWEELPKLRKLHIGTLEYPYWNFYLYEKNGQEISRTKKIISIYE